jgi:hypothetical protein
MDRRTVTRLVRVVRLGTLIFLAGNALGAARNAAGLESGLIGIVFDNPALAKPGRVWPVAEPRAALAAEPAVTP